jgi:hypothetical protein
MSELAMSIRIAETIHGVTRELGPGEVWHELDGGNVLSIARATHFAEWPADQNAESDWDYAGGCVVEFELCDSDGNPSQAMEAMADEADRELIEAKLCAILTETA